VLTPQAFSALMQKIIMDIQYMTVSNCGCHLDCTCSEMQYNQDKSDWNSNGSA